MSGRVGMLGVVLALQLAVAGVLLLTARGGGDAQGGPLLTFAAAEVDAIELHDGAGQSVALDRVGDGWQLADGHPADAAKVTELLERLSALEAAWPVATTAAAADRFEVSADSHQRQVILRAGERTLADAYFGTSPGFQRVHARRADDEAVYSVGLSNYQLPVSSNDWLDRTLLQPRGELTAVAREGEWALSRSDEGWLLDGAAADQEAAADLARRFSELRVSGVAAGLGDGFAAQAEFRLADADGDYRLTLHADAAGDAFRLTSDRRDGVYEVAAFVAERLLQEADGLRPGDAAASNLPP